MESEENSTAETEKDNNNTEEDIDIINTEEDECDHAECQKCGLCFEDDFAVDLQWYIVWLQMPLILKQQSIFQNYIAVKGHFHVVS